MSEPRDQELEDYLAGKSEISRLYHQAPTQTPSPALDAKIKAAARRELAQRRPRWMMPLSAAAVLMLSIGVLLQMQKEGVTPVPTEETATQTPAATFQVPTVSAPVAGDAARSAPRIEAQVEMRSRESKAAVAEPFPAPAMAPGHMQGKAQSQSDDKAASAPSGDESEALMSSPAAGESARMERDTPLSTEQEWIERIRRLRTEGRVGEAEIELEKFREHYPDHPLPEDLLPQQH